MPEQDDGHLTVKEFRTFIENDFNHVKCAITGIKDDMESVKRQVSFVKGQLIVAVPLILVMLGMTIAVYVR